MKKLHPIWFAVSFAGLFITLIIIINYYTVSSSTLTSYKNQLTELNNQIQQVENQAQKETKDLNRFQAKKYGIEAITPQDQITP